MEDGINIISLKCSSCGAILEISPDMEHFACGYCGVEQIVERRGGTVALKQVSEAIARVQKATDKTAAELAIRRLTSEIADKQNDLSAEASRHDELMVQMQAKHDSNSWLMMACLGLLACLVTLCFDRLLSIIIGCFSVFFFLRYYFAQRSLNQDLEKARKLKEEATRPIREEIAKLELRLAENKAVVD